MRGPITSQIEHLLSLPLSLKAPRLDRSGIFPPFPLVLAGEGGERICPAPVAVDFYVIWEQGAGSSADSSLEKGGEGALSTAERLRPLHRICA